MNVRKRFPKLLLCITLIIAFVLAGITQPGFLLPFFEPAVPKQEGILEDEYYVEPEGGNSRAFEITADQGFVISAEENALDKDRDFAVTALGAQDRKNLTEA